MREDALQKNEAKRQRKVAADVGIMLAQFEAIMGCIEKSPAELLQSAAYSRVAAVIRRWFDDLGRGHFFPETPSGSNAAEGVK